MNVMRNVSDGIISNLINRSITLISLGVNDLFWCHIKPIMNVSIRVMVGIFSFGERWDVPINSASPR